MTKPGLGSSTTIEILDIINTVCPLSLAVMKLVQVLEQWSTTLAPSGTPAYGSGRQLTSGSNDSD